MDKNVFKDFENYTFSKYSNENNFYEKFPRIKSSFKNSIVNFQQINNINDKSDKYSNHNLFEFKHDSNSNNKDINYNKLNITHYDKSPLKKKNNNINNINIISQNMNHLNNHTNYNNIDKININKNNKRSYSKERKFDKRKFRTPDNHYNYNKFNNIYNNNSDDRIDYDYKKSKNNHLKLSNIINYNDNIKYKNNRRIKKRALTPDNTYHQNNRGNGSNQKNENTKLNPINYNISIINPNSNLYSKNYNFSYKDSSLRQYAHDNNNNSNNIDVYNYQNSIKYKTEYDPKYNSNYDYQKSDFNTRLPRGAKLPLRAKINKNLFQSVIYNNKTPSPIKKNNNYLSSGLYNTNNKKYLRYTRSVSSEPLLKKKQNYFLSKYFRKDNNLNISSSNISTDNINSYLDKKYNKIFNNTNTSCGYYNSSLVNTDKNNSLSNEKKYNMTQPDFSKSLLNYNNKNNNNLYFNYLKFDLQKYNYNSYIESNNSKNKDNQNNKNSSNSNISLKTKKYNFEKNLNLNNYTTKFSTNNNTYDENSNISNSLYFKEQKTNNKMINTNTIEEVHLNFVKILQNTKNMMEKQENYLKDKILYNNKNTTTIILEEREIE